MTAGTEARPLGAGLVGARDEFATIRAIQDHLIEQAAADGVVTVDPAGLGELTQSIVDEIVQATAADPDVV